MTTSDGQGINFKYLTAISGAVIIVLLSVSGWLISKIVNDKDTQLCGIQDTLKNVKGTVDDVKLTVTKLENNQTWTMVEMRRVAEELKTHEEAAKKAVR